MFLFSETGAELPFKEPAELIEYVRNLDLENLDTEKTLNDLMAPTDKMPDDPALLKGLRLFENGKHEESAKYFYDLQFKGKTPFQKEFSQYQLWHLGSYGMTDPYYDGRPSKIDRSKGIKLGDTFSSVLWNDNNWRAVLILKSNPADKFFDPRFWEYRELTKSSKFSSSMISILQSLDLETFHVLLKSFYSWDKKRSNKNFPKGLDFESTNEVVDFCMNEYDEASDNCERDLSRFMASAGGDMPVFKKLRIGLELDKAGKHQEAFNYFKKMANASVKFDWRWDFNFQAYAEYQCWHILAYGEADPYYDGRPSLLKRKNFSYKENRLYEPKDKKRNNVYQVDLKTLDLINLAHGVQENTLKYGDLSILMSRYVEDNGLHTSLLCNEVRRIFSPENNTGIFTDYLKSHQYSASKYRTNDNINIDGLYPLLKFMPLISKMKPDEENILGVGLTSKELYNTVLAEVPTSFSDLKFDKGYKKDDHILSLRQNIYLLRSAFWGNTDAMNLFILTNASNVNSWGYTSKESSLLRVNVQWSKKLYNFISQLKEQTSLGLHKDLIDYYHSQFKEVYDNHYEVFDSKRKHDLEQYNRRKQQEKEERARMWSNIIGSTLQGFAQGLNAYSQYQGMVTPAYPYVGSSNYNIGSFSGGSVVEMMQDPNYFSNVQQAILQQSINQVMAQEWQDYTRFREQYQRTGQDITLDQYRALQGAAIMMSNNEGSSFSSQGSTTNTTSTGNSSGPMCKVCKGSGRVLKRGNPGANFGISKTSRKCDECGEFYDPDVTLHYHQSCSACKGTGYL